MDEVNTSYNNKQIMTDYIQFIVIFVVICVSSVNLTFQWGNQNLWTGILIGSIGYIMPGPKFNPSFNFGQLNKNIQNHNQNI